MALVNSEGNYLKIECVDLINNTVCVKVYESKEIRDMGETDFRKAKIEYWNIPTLKMLLGILVPNNLATFEDQIKTICYNELIKVNGFVCWDSIFTSEQEPVVESIKQAIEEIIPPLVENPEEVVENIE